ncbi:MAG TPA: hypothetical protein VKZ67_07100 [Natronosporangium sp.]|nr:hypothetical protein [Natronosporangium sp.]
MRETPYASPAGGWIVTASDDNRRGLVEVDSQPFHAAGTREPDWSTRIRPLCRRGRGTSTTHWIGSP